MNCRILGLGLAIVFFIAPSWAMEAPKLGTISFAGASVVPYAIWPNFNAYFLLGREAGGPDKGTWSDFGGARDKGELHPVFTAARELNEETMHLLPIQNLAEYLEHYLDPQEASSVGTGYVIVVPAWSAVTYLTKFAYETLNNFAKNFYTKRAELLEQLKKPQSGKALKNITNQLEKDSLAWVEWGELKKAIANTKRFTEGPKKRSVSVLPTVTAYVVDEHNKIHKQSIFLRPELSNKLEPFFQDKPYVQGEHPRIRIYKP
jgi:hypothetical protein